MSKVILGQEMGKRLIEKLGLPDRIVQMDISIRADEPVVITLQRMMGVDEAGELTHELRRYGLVDMDPADPICTADKALAEIKARYQAAMDWLENKHGSDCYELGLPCIYADGE